MEQQTNVLYEFAEPSFEYAGAGQRFLNYIIDTIVFYILFILVMAVYGIIMAASLTEADLDSTWFTLLSYAIAIAIFLIYYTLLEGAKGKTLGKLITKTKVVTDDGEKISYKQAFLRTLSRFVPFEAFTGFSGAKMWHDSWTQTMTVKDR